MTQEDLEKKVSHVEVSLVKNSESLKGLHRRLDKLEKNSETISELALCLRDVAGEVKAMRGDLNDLSERVHNMEMKPAKRWNSAVETFISVTIGALVGYIFSMML